MQAVESATRHLFLVSDQCCRHPSLSVIDQSQFSHNYTVSQWFVVFILCWRRAAVSDPIDSRERRNRSVPCRRQNYLVKIPDCMDLLEYRSCQAGSHCSLLGYRYLLTAILADLTRNLQFLVKRDWSCTTWLVNLNLALHLFNVEAVLLQKHKVTLLY